MVTQDLLASHVIGLFLETLLFGIFIVAYSVGTWFLVRGDQPRSLRIRNGILLAANTAMLGLAIAVSPHNKTSLLGADWRLCQHIALTMRIVIHGFVFSGTDIEGVYDYFFFYGNAGQGAQFYIYVTQTLIGDGFMV